MHLTENVLHVRYLVPKIDLDVARAAVALRRDRYKGKDYLVLVDSKGLTSMTHDARQYLSLPAAYAGVKAAAFVVRSQLTVVMANFYLRMGNFPIPTKLFSSKTAATRWLLQHNDKDSS